MMKCQEIDFVGCLCANCVRNASYCVNTPVPCIMADCDLCEKFNCDEVFCHYCSGHLTIEEVNERIEKGEYEYDE